MNKREPQLKEGDTVYTSIGKGKVIRYVKPQKYRCLDCGRDTFDRPNQPHWCNGNFRKHKQVFVPVEPVCEHKWDWLLDPTDIVCSRCGERYPKPANLAQCEHQWTYGSSNGWEYCIRCGEAKPTCTDSRSLEDVEHCCGEQMPLRAEFERIILSAIWGSHKWYNLSDTLNKLESVVEAHNQQVRKAFTKECPFGMFETCLAHITRALAEEK